MPGLRTKLAAAVAAGGVLAAGGAGIAAGRDDHRMADRGHGVTVFHAALTGYEEVPAVSTTASGTFTAVLSEKHGALAWKLTYRDLEAPIQQAHVHFGQRGVNGGVSLFLCSNLGNAPATVKRCPAPPATVTGFATARDVVGPAEQGIEPGEGDELIAAMQAGLTYANVHSDKFPAGEARGQIAVVEKKH